jgi:uncharacterized protein (TIGR02145 family)
MYLEGSLGMSVDQQQSTVSDRGMNIGGDLKSLSMWLSPNVGATNLYAFTAVPSGYRNPAGNYAFIEYLGYEWCTSESDANAAWHRRQNYYDSYNNRFANDKHFGFGVRCVRD